MKQIYCLRSLFSIVTLALASALGIGNARADEVNLIFVSLVPTGSPVVEGAYHPWVDRINTAVPPNGTIYMLDVNYYGDAERHVFEKDGLIRPDIATSYVTRRTFQPGAGTSFVWAFSKRPPAAPAGTVVTDLGESIYRVER